MTTDNNTTEVEQQASPAQQVRNDWRVLMGRMSYKAIIENIPYLAFLALLCVLYISNNHKSVEVQREISRNTKTLEELHWKYGDVKAGLMRVKTETEIMKNAKEIGLEPAILPAYRISKN